MRKALGCVCLFAASLFCLSLPSAAQEIIHALTGTVSGIDAVTKTITVLQDNGCIGIGAANQQFCNAGHVANGSLAMVRALQVSSDVFYYQLGDFMNALISFLIIAAVVYFLIVAPMAKLVLRLHGAKEATERDCPECLSSIPIAATRCSFCTVPVPPVAR